jgi:adenine deaminase
MWLLIREATAARNLHALLPLLAEYGPGRIAFCTDDREPEHIADDGHINAMVREAVAFGIPPEDALVCATCNPALWHRLDVLGAIAPGYQADVLILPDLERFVPELVLKAGGPWRRSPRRRAGLGAPHHAHRRARAGDVPHPVGRRAGARDRDRAGADRHRLARRRAAVRAGEAIADAERDLAKIAVIERHLGTGRTGSASFAASACSAGRSRRRSRTTRTTWWSSA